MRCGEPGVHGEHTGFNAEAQKHHKGHNQQKTGLSFGLQPDTARCEGEGIAAAGKEINAEQGAVGTTQRIE